MAKKLKAGDVVHGYLITRVFGPGMMAISYGAEAPGGGKVFFKQYKSPSPTVVWFKGFIDYQRELSRRVSTGKAAHFAVRQVDAFVEEWGGPCYFQAFEFVENGADLEEMLEAEAEEHRRTGRAPAKDAAVWMRHVTWARVFMAAVASLHESGIVHADLKPANAYLIKDPSIAAGFQLKLIDMDFSLLADRKPPWHGFQGYVGSDKYRSPEHMARGSVPGLPSDVFTCGLILYELLAGYHPYWKDDQAEYAQLVRAHAAKPPALLGEMPEPAGNAEVSAMLHRSLSPDPAKRPSAAELQRALAGRTTGATAARPRAPGAAEGRAAVAPLTADRIELVGPDGKSLTLGVRTELGRTLVGQLGPDGQFWDPAQCVLERDAKGQWVVVPAPGTTNETLVNGAAVTRLRALRNGDQIAVGRQAKGIAKMPLTVRGR
jgi:eukaryotic-like serine/threonine-protein kinase